MALGDILATLNPMDYVTGMEKGLKLGQQRGITEQATAFGEKARISTEEFGGAAETERRAAETALGTTTAKLGDFLKNMELEVGRMNEGPMKETLTSQLNTLKAQQQTHEQRALGTLGREPALQAQYDLQAKQNARLFPQILERQEAKFNFDGVLAEAERGNQTAQMRLNNAVRGADNIVRSIMGDPNNAQIARDPYAVTELALKQVTDPDQRAYLVTQQDKIAKAKLAENIGSAAGLAMWLPRAQPNMRVEQVPNDPTRIKVITSNVVDRVDPATGQRTQTTQETDEVLTLDVNNDAYGRTQQWLLGVTGQKVPFIQPNLRDVKPTPQSPTAAAQAIQTGGASRTQGAAATPPAAGAASTGGAAPMGPPTMEQANAQELGGLQRQLQTVTGLPEDPQRARAVGTLLKELSKRPGEVSPDQMRQLRTLVEQAARTRPMTETERLGFGQTTPLPQRAQPTVQELIQQVQPR